MKRFCIGLLLFLLAAGAYAAEDKPTRTLSVTGTAEVNVAPDICYLSFGVQTRDPKSATAAYKANAGQMDAVIAAVKTAGIPAKDIQTANLNLAPQYRYEEKPSRRLFDGYLVTHSLNVKVRDLAKVSSVLDAAVSAGATEVGSVSFTVENPKKYTADARVEALKAARAKAEKIAEVAGVKLGRPLSISENEPGGWGRYYAQANVALDRAESASMEMPLEPGEMKLTHTVNITYEIE